jgi:tetratricopeptide (TPR) repeat protein
MKKRGHPHLYLVTKGRRSANGTKEKKTNRTSKALRIESAKPYFDRANDLWNQGLQDEALTECLIGILSIGGISYKLHDNPCLEDLFDKNILDVLYPTLTSIAINFIKTLCTYGMVDEVIQQCVDATASYAKRSFDYASYLYDEGRYDEAIDAYLTAIQADPDDPDFRNNIGVCLCLQGRHGEAAAAFRKAIELSEDYVWAHRNLGLCLAMHLQCEEAIQSFKTTLSLNPYYFDAHMGIGLCCAYHARYDEAIAALVRAIEEEPDEPDVHYHLGVCFSAINKNAEAIQAYTKAIELKPENAAAHYNLAVLLYSQGNSAAATRAARKAADLLRNNGKPVNLAVSFSLGDENQIIASIKNGRPLTPDYRGALAQLGKEHLVAMNTEEYV